MKSCLDKYVIIILGIIVYHNSFSSGWYFDGEKILEVLQAADRPAALDNFLSIKGASYIGYFGWLSFYLNQFIRVNGVWEYHLINLIIHIVNALLVYQLVTLTFTTPYFSRYSDSDSGYRRSTALAAGALFAVHPITTQSVTYLYQRITSLAAMLYLLSLIFYIKFRLSEVNRGKKQTQILFYFISFIAINIGLYTKHQPVTLPAVLLLYEVCFFPAHQRSEWKKKLLYIFPFFIAVLMRILWFDFYLIHFKPTIDKQNVAAYPHASSRYHVSRLIYFLSEFRVIITYLRLMLFPTNQTFLYDYPYAFSLFEFPAFISFVSLLCILIFALWIFKRSRLLSFSMLWFFMNIAPISSIVPERWLIFEHRMYLPAIGIIIAFAAVLMRLYFSAKNNKHIIASLIVICMVIIIAFHSLILIKRNYIWIDEIILLEDIVKKAPNNVMALSILGVRYFSQGKDSKAEQYMKRALAVHPSYIYALHRLTDYYVKQGRLEDAIELNKRGLKFTPDNPVHIKRRLKYLYRLLDKLNN